VGSTAYLRLFECGSSRELVGQTRILQIEWGRENAFHHVSCSPRCVAHNAPSLVPGIKASAVRCKTGERSVHPRCCAFTCERKCYTSSGTCANTGLSRANGLCFPAVESLSLSLFDVWVIELRVVRVPCRTTALSCFVLGPCTKWPKKI
jgi:hypothetical protein